MSASTKPQSRIKVPKAEIAADLRDELRDVAKRLLVLYSLWPSWMVSGSWIVGDPSTPAVGKITTTDDVGREILSYMPLSLVAAFLSADGQAFVSHSGRHHTFSVLINNSDDPSDQYFNDVRPVVSCQSLLEQRIHDLWL